MRLSWVAGALLVPAALGAQTTVSTATAFLATAGGHAVAQLRAGASVTRIVTHGAWTRVVLSGYLHRSVVGGKRDTFAISANADGGALLRRSPSRSGAVLALLADGMGLTQVSRHGDWLRVTRTGWVATSALTAAHPTTVASAPKAGRAASRAPARTSAAAQRAPAPARRTAARAASADSTAVAEGDVTPDSTPPAPPAVLAVEHHAMLYVAPDAQAVGTVDSTARVTQVARDRGWVRVQVEGWMRATDLGPADASVLTTISAADLRAQPDRYRGQTVRWQVQKIAVETADPLRKGMAPDEPYVLARGPGQENSLLYLALPPSLVDQARRIDPLATFIVTARVRNGRSEPAGVPLLDVLAIATR